MLPFIIPEGELPFKNLDYLYIPNIRKAVEDKQSEITAYVIKDGKAEEFKLGLGAMTDDEREIILKGCLEVPSIVPPFVRIPEKSERFIIR